MERFDYPDYMMKALFQLMKLSVSDKYPLLSRGSEIIDMLYNPSNNYPVKPQVLKMMWWWVRTMIDAGKDEWVKMYWVKAVEYYFINLQNSQDDTVKEDFKEFHVMMGTLLLSKKKYELLKYCLYFSNSNPPKYYLVPSTYREIFNWYRMLSDKNYRSMYLLQYPLWNEFLGASEEMKIEGCLMDYIGLLLVRLKSVDDYNITYSNPMDTPDVGDTKEENEGIIRTINKLKEKIGFFDDKELRSVGFGTDEKLNALNLLDKYSEECRYKISIIENSLEISQDKKNSLKNNLIGAINNFKNVLPSNGKIENTVAHKYMSGQRMTLDNNLILSGYDGIWSNIEESLIGVIHYNLYYYYYQLLNRVNPLFSFNISYMDFTNVLKKLNMSKDYTILAFGLNNYLPEYSKGFERDSMLFNNVAPFYEIPNRSTSCFIMKTDDVPFYSEERIENNEDGCSLIEPNHFLYSNIDSLDAYSLLLIVKQLYKIYIPNKWRYLRIRVSYELNSNAEFVSNIKSIKDYIG